MVKRLALLALCLACAAPARPEPPTVWAPWGPIPVRYVVGFRHYGMWEAAPRRITLRAGMAPVLRTQTLYHESCHAILFELGASLADEDEEDRVCDAIATARVLEQQKR